MSTRTARPPRTGRGVASQCRAMTAAEAAAVAALLAGERTGGTWRHADLLADLARADRAWLVAAAGPSDGLVGAIGVAALPDDVAEVLDLVVARAHRRTGVARRLLAAAGAAAAARGARRLELEVAESNAAARALYADEGFVTVRRRRGYGADGGDALVLARPLPHVDR